MGMEGDTPTSAGGSPHAALQPVFPLPPEYEEAKERKVASVADLRNAVKTVRPASSLPSPIIAAEYVSSHGHSCILRCLLALARAMSMCLLQW